MGLAVHAHAATCYQSLKNEVLFADLEQLEARLSTLDVKEWDIALKEFGIVVPEAPVFLQKWGSPESQFAYRDYLLKQAIGQRVATHYEKLSKDFLDSPVGAELLSDPQTAPMLRERMPQILLALAASGEVPLKKVPPCGVQCRTRMGEQAYQQLVRAVELESFSLDNEKVKDWTFAIRDMMQTRPELWEAMQSRVKQPVENIQVRNFMSDRGFPRFAEHFKYDGWFVRSDLNLFRFDNQPALAPDIRSLFSTENAACCGTNCGNCPLGFPVVLKDAQTKLSKENQAHAAQFSRHLRSSENDTIYAHEQKVILASITKTEDTLRQLSDESFGIFSGRAPLWLDSHFRKGVLEAQVDFMVIEQDLVLRHARHSQELKSAVLRVLKNPLLRSNARAQKLLAELLET